MDGNQDQKKYLKGIQSKVKFNLFLLKRLPSAYWWNLSVKEINHHHCEVSIPFNWRTQNPFKSIYFAALAGAGELSTGLLCQLHLAGRGRWSMLVTDLQCKFIKKANEEILFTCDQGSEVKELLDRLDDTDDSETLTMKSVGVSRLGAVVCEVYITWSFKQKRNS